MKFHFVSELNTSLGSELFATNRPFENVSTSSKSFSQMRDRASPSLTSVSIHDNFRNRGHWWFHNNWNITITNATSITINSINVQITARHNFGSGNFRTRDYNQFVSSLSPQQTFSSNIFPPNQGFNTMIMDGFASADLDFVVTCNYTADIQFNWGGLYSQSTFGTQLTTTTQALSTWGANRGVNVTVNIF